MKWIEDFIFDLFDNVPKIPFGISCFMILTIFLLKEIVLNENCSIEHIITLFFRQLYMILLFISIPVMFVLLFICFYFILT